MPIPPILILLYHIPPLSYLSVSLPPSSTYPTATTTTTTTHNTAIMSNEGEKINTSIVTLTRFLNEEQSKHPEASGDFT